jgi:protein phosphatase
MSDVSDNRIAEDAISNCRFFFGALTDVGMERQRNEDSCYVNSELGLFVVSDGMGGHRGGDIASRIVAEDLPVMVETGLHKLRTGSVGAVKRLLKNVIIEQNRHLHLEGTSESGYKDMGATLVMALMWKGRVYVANLGDSRAYRLRGSVFRQLSRDHSVVGELVESGKLSPEQVQGHDAEGQITHYVGMEDKPEPYVTSFSVRKGDRLLLCSDGLTDMVDDFVIKAILGEDVEAGLKCTKLIELANKAGGHDNVTAVVVEFTGFARERSGMGKAQESKQSAGAENK